MSRLLLIILIFLALPCPLPAAVLDDMFTNVPTHPGATYRPGAMVVLPNGQRAIIEESLPNGQWRTDLGIILTREGVIAEGPESGEQVILVTPQNPDEKVQTPDEKTPIIAQEPEKSTNTPQEQQVVIAPEMPAAPEKPASPEETAIAPQQQKQPDMTPPREEQLTLAELLPMTRVPEKAEQPAPKTEKKAQPTTEKPIKQDEKKTHEQKPAKEEKKTAPKPEQHKVKPGQEMRIPPEAAKTGNLDFLEGCWQGTRPEYYSKRTIRECFCFGANGKNGKRRVFDPLGKRQCIGATRASLSKSGVLSVTSSGAACNDGERWGQAEMVCHNSGPRTPCSWVFRDANNGSQSYEIPFVRVESCGR